MSVKQFENKRWTNDDQVMGFRHKAALSMSTEGKVLDLGSGDGLFLSLLKQKGIAGEGLDISEEGVAKTRAKGLSASVFDFNDPIPFADNTFDTVVSLDVLEHLYAPQVLLKEAVRVSKKYVIIGVPNFSSLPARLQVLFGKVPENNRPNKGHIYWFNHKVLVSMLSANGLMVESVQSNTFFEHIPVVGSITRFCARVMPNAFSLSFVVKAKKNIKPMKLVYVYAGSRKGKLQGDVHVDYPDTSLYGENYLEKMSGLSVAYRETSDFVHSPFLRKLLGFRLLHALTYFYTARYDIVIGPSLFYALLLRKIYATKSRFIVLNISLTRFIQTKKNAHMRRLIGWVLNGASAIVCFSQVQKEFLQKAIPTFTGKIVVVPLGVDAVFYTPHYEGREDFILSVGRDNGRDYATVIEVARLLPQKKFVLVCSKRNLVGVHDMPHNVTVHYDLSVQELRELYYRARLLLLVTHDDAYVDGSDCSGQTVLLDAMAAGLPVVASEKAYIHEYVKDDEEALLVHFYDANDILKKIDLLEDPARRLKMARLARSRVEKEFSTARMAEGLYRVILDVSGLPL